MKGLYYRLAASQEEETFVFQESEPVSSPSDYHVKLQVKACALTPINTKLISALYPSKEHVPVGRDVAGVVLEVGPKVSFFKPDDEVVGILPLDCEESGLCDVIWVHEHHLARVIDVSKGNVNLTEKGIEETGGLGFDIIVDAGVILYNTEDSVTKPTLLPHKHEIISLLSVGGRWVTREQHLQLDPPDSNILFLKGASLSYLNEETWNLSSSQQGKYLHILLLPHPDEDSSETSVISDRRHRGRGSET
ncbi:hypothetical protein GDO78_009001 [Eleutherodactylus coqui]|uniref:Alcohol dehydrogenase-like N-terminal domain-containing protein n=1 Tax=Eleutherodactylus coqui TaxID=57060 RepID=A0A8J6FET6_ELECQ|nr:hypothetical protein GDO78_009001 [Eleutherodactylus coqui]